MKLKRALKNQRQSGKKGFGPNCPPIHSLHNWSESIDHTITELDSSTGDAGNSVQSEPSPQQ